MQILIELDDETLRRVERIAPGKSRRRSAFIRSAILRALWEIDEERTRRAYLAEPDGEPVPFDPEVWEPLPFGGFDPPGSALPKTKKRAAKQPSSARKARGR
jgi:hypothetical protein